MNLRNGGKASGNLLDSEVFKIKHKEMRFKIT